MSAFCAYLKIEKGSVLCVTVGAVAICKIRKVVGFESNDSSSDTEYFGAGWVSKEFLHRSLDNVLIKQAC